MKIKKSLNKIFILTLVTIIIFVIMMLLAIIFPVDTGEIMGFYFYTYLFKIKGSFLVIIAFFLMIPLLIMTVASKKQRNLKTKNVLFIQSGILTLITGFVTGWTIYFMSLINDIFSMDFIGIIILLLLIVIMILLIITTAISFLLAVSIPSEQRYEQGDYNNETDRRHQNNQRYDEERRVETIRPHISPVKNEKSVVEQLKDLKMIFDEGIITESEYEEKRKEVLKKL